ncbi:MAG TPA: LytTR family DNA-binding domain-containing protein [Kofleriaceae bacterium]|nr:LytTR family DNA-binding domain-containing protein [Kofleriaceae bacterium]
MLIVDDEPLARLGLRRCLVDEPGVAIDECGSGHGAVRSIVDLAPDLVFLDVQLPDLEGFAVIEAVGPDRMPPVVFVTAHDRYAVRAFEAAAVDYVLKPFRRERVIAAFARARSRVGAGATCLAIRDVGMVRLVEIDRITRIEAADNYVVVHADRESIVWRQTLASAAARLAGARFVRIHRSTLVNARRIREVQSIGSGDCRVLLDDGTALTASRRFRVELEAALGVSASG